MKRLITLFLLLIFLLNVLGFYGVFLGMKLQNSMVATRAIDEERYSMDETITFRVPITVPYYTDQQADYNRVDGEFEHNGEVYRMVKQKLQHDTLFVVCIQDQKSKEINASMAEYIKTFAGKPANAKEQSLKSFSFLKDYVPFSITMMVGLAGWHKVMSFPEPAHQVCLSASAEIFLPPKLA